MRQRDKGNSWRADRLSVAPFLSVIAMEIANGNWRGGGQPGEPTPSLLPLSPSPRKKKTRGHLTDNRSFF